MADQIVSIRFINKQYGAHARTILSRLDYIDEVEDDDRKRGSMRKYKVLKALPTVEEFRQLRTKHFTSTVDSLMDDAFSEFESLKEELESWYENLPEQFQQGDKGNMIEEAMNTLDQIDRPDIPDNAGTIEVYHQPAEKVESRSDRCSEAVSIVQDIISALNDKAEELREAATGKSEEEAKKEPDPDDLESFASDLESAIGDAESVEFPGMY
jgi:hypothetical protein